MAKTTVESTVGTVRDQLKQSIEDRDRRDWVIDLGPFVMLLVLALIFTASTNTFLTYRNIVNNLLQNSMLLLLVGLAGTFPILQQSIDLSVAAIVSLTAVVTAMLADEFGVLSLFIAIGVGGLVGAFNGMVFTKFKLPSFLVTLGVLEMLDGISLILTEGVTIPFRNETMTWIATGEIIPTVPNLVFWGGLFYFVTIFIGFKTPFGRYTYALGENERVVDLSGVKVDRYKIGAFVLSGLLCGIAGALLAARVGAGSPGMGSGLLLESIAAIVIGGTALTGGVGGPHRTLLGVLVIAVLDNGMSLAGIDPFIQRVILGAVVIFAIALSIDRRKIDIVK